MESVRSVEPCRRNSSAFFRLLIFGPCRCGEHKNGAVIEIKCYKNRRFSLPVQNIVSEFWRQIFIVSLLKSWNRSAPASVESSELRGWLNVAEWAHTKTSHDLTWPGVKRVLLYCPSVWHFINVYVWPRSRNIHKLDAISIIINTCVG